MTENGRLRVDLLARGGGVGGGVVVAGVAARALGGGLLAGRQRHGGLVVEVGGEVVDMDGVRRLAAAHARDGDGDAVAGTRLQQVIDLMF